MAFVGSTDFSRGGAVGRATGGGAVEGEQARYVHLVKEGIHDKEGLLMADSVHNILQYLDLGSRSKVLRVDRSATSLTFEKNLVNINRFLCEIPDMMDERVLVSCAKQFEKEELSHSELLVELVSKAYEDELRQLHVIYNALYKSSGRGDGRVVSPSIEMCNILVPALSELTKKSPTKMYDGVGCLKTVFNAYLRNESLPHQDIQRLITESSAILGFAFLDRELVDQCEFELEHLRESVDRFWEYDASFIRAYDHNIRDLFNSDLSRHSEHIEKYIQFIEKPGLKRKISNELTRLSWCVEFCVLRTRMPW